MTRLLSAALLSLALVCGASASAQSFTSSPEVGTYQAQTMRYPNVAIGEAPVLGDGSNAKGGIAPAFTRIPEPADPTANNPFTGWFYGPAAANQNCLSTNDLSKGCNERKARFTANSCLNSFKRDDPIRYWGQPGVAHLHEFFVSCEANAFSTYRSLRLRRGVPHTGPGGPIVGTGYWEPAWLKTIAGKVYAMPGTMNTIYYTRGVQPNVPIIDELQPLHLLFRFIGGVNMDDPDNLQAKAAVDAANAAIKQSNPSSSGTYWRWRTNGFNGYICENKTIVNGQTVWTGTKAKHADGSTGNDYAEGFTLPDGTDPWQGQCGINGNKARIMASGIAPDCWDGVNVSSPSGYGHVSYSVIDENGQYPGGVCPMNQFRVPAFEIKAHHTTSGWDDYKTWRLASDAMMAAKLGRAVVPGASFHFDWMNGWHKPTMDKWQSFCMGINSNQPHDCNDSAINNDMVLITSAAAPDGSRLYQVDGSFDYDTSDVTKLHLVGDARVSEIHAH